MTFSNFEQQHVISFGWTPPGAAAQTVSRPKGHPKTWTVHWQTIVFTKIC